MRELDFGLALNTKIDTRKPRIMKPLFKMIAVAWLLCLMGNGSLLASEATLDVLKMKDIPEGQYLVQMELEGKSESVTVVIRRNRAAFVKASSSKLDGLSGGFELIGNGVYLARLSGGKHAASQWWLFQPDGTAIVKEIPDRGEKQIARPVTKS
jgi:hypothetical protein